MRHLEVWVFSLDGPASPLECLPKGFGFLQSNRCFPLPKRDRSLHHKVKPLGWNRMGWDGMRWDEMKWDGLKWDGTG